MLSKRTTRNQGKQTLSSPVRMGWQETDFLFPKEIRLIKPPATIMLITFEPLTSVQSRKEHHEGELKTRQSQDMDQPEWTTRVWQSSILKARERLNWEKGASQLIFTQCTARRQPRQCLNYCQWVGQFNNVSYHLDGQQNYGVEIPLWSQPRPLPTW